MSKNNPTSREHYVPKAYLNGFASENKRLYFYDLNTRLHSNIMIDVDTICFQRNLYEYKDKNNEIILTNRIEKVLAAMERRLNRYRTSIREQIKVVDPHTHSFLTEDEIAYWITYITFQMFRLPKMIDEVTNVLQEIIPPNGDANMHRNTALNLLLPFLKPLEPDSIETRFFSMFYEGFYSMKHTIAYDEKHRLFTSDCPVYTYAPTWYAPNKRISNCEKLIFPIDESLCFIFSRTEKYPDNGIFLIDDREYESICKSIAYAAEDKLFTKRKFTRQEKEWIRIALTDKQKDHSKLGLQ